MTTGQSKRELKDCTCCSSNRCFRRARVCQSAAAEISELSAESVAFLNQRVRFAKLVSSDPMVLLLAEVADLGKWKVILKMVRIKTCRWYYVKFLVALIGARNVR